MELRSVGIVVVVLIGVGAIGYGLAVGDEGTHSLEVQERINENEFQNSTEETVIEYDYLHPDLQDAFREALESGDEVEISRSPDAEDPIVHYRDAYYPVSEGFGDAGQQTMVISIMVGIVLILTGTLSWSFFNRE